MALVQDGSGASWRERWPRGQRRWARRDRRRPHLPL